MDNTVLICGLAIFALPLFSFAVLALFNRRMPRRGDFIAITGPGTIRFQAAYISLDQMTAATQQLKRGIAGSDIIKAFVGSALSHN